MKIGFLVLSADISGGTYVIFKHALYLQKQGYDVSIIREHNTSKAEVKWFPDAEKLNFTNYSDSKDEIYDLVIATWWATTFNLQRLRSKTYCYFVQSIESRFYPETDFSARFLADSTYLYDLPIITEATWIKESLTVNYNKDVELAVNGIDKDIFKLEGEAFEPRDPDKLRILVEGPVDVDFKNVPRTLDLCIRSNADEVWLLTSSSNVSSYPGVSRVFSRLPSYDVAKVYRSCDVIVKLSFVEGMFGPPLEMFHCGGTAIVYNVSGHDEYIENNVNSIVIESKNEQGVFQAINRLKHDKKLLAELKTNAIKTAEKWPNWETSSKEFEKNLLKLTSKSSETQESLTHKTKLLMSGYSRLANPLEKAEIEVLKKIIGEKEGLIQQITTSKSFLFMQEIRRIKEAIA